MVLPRIWLLACAWCLIGWAAPVQASWEAYQRAGEAAYNHGRYAEAELLFLAAVREARHAGLQGPRLDISLNKLVLLRVVRGRSAKAGNRSQPIVENKETTRQRPLSRHGRQRQPPRTALQRVKPGDHPQALLPARPGAPSKSVRASVSQQEHRLKRPHTVLHRTQPTHRALPQTRPGKRWESARRREDLRTSRLQQPAPRRQGQAPHLQQSRQLQRPHPTLHRAGPPRAGRPLRPGSKRRRTPARSTRQAMLHTGQPRMAQLWLLQGVTA